MEGRRCLNIIYQVCKLIHIFSLYSAYFKFIEDLSQTEVRRLYVRSRRDVRFELKVYANDTNGPTALILNNSN